MSRTSRTRPATRLLVAAVVAAVVSSTLAVSPSVVSASTPSDGPAVEQVATDGWTVSTTRDELAVSGRSNRASGTTVVVELVHSNGTTLRTATATVSNGTWNATLDVATLAPGTYQLRVTDGAVAASTSVALVSTTPSETPFETTTAAAASRTPTATAAATVVSTPAPLPSPVPTLARSPGFDAAAALVALSLSAGALAWRRHRRR
jgi:hypothetical protein